jgi:dTMP kinase
MSTFAASSTRETKRGIFILFEGVDRCGKTTQSQLLAQKLADDTNDIKAELIRFPDRTTTIGQIIDSYLKSKSELNDHSIHLLFSANRWEAKKSIEEKLNAGIHLVCDRYAYSGVAFTSAKEGMDLNWCKSCDSGLPSPDCIIYLDILPEEASQVSLPSHLSLCSLRPVN